MPPSLQPSQHPSLPSQHPLGPQIASAVGSLSRTRAGRACRAVRTHRRPAGRLGGLGGGFPSESNIPVHTSRTPHHSLPHPPPHALRSRTATSLSAPGFPLRRLHTLPIRTQTYPPPSHTADPDSDRPASRHFHATARAPQRVGGRGRIPRCWRKPHRSAAQPAAPRNTRPAAGAVGGGRPAAAHGLKRN
jgi:hypothetical protein